MIGGPTKVQIESSTKVQIGSTTQLGTILNTISIENSSGFVTGSSAHTVTSSTLDKQSVETTEVVTILLLDSTMKEIGNSTTQAPGSTLQSGNGTTTQELNGFQIDEETEPANGSSTQPINGTTAQPFNGGKTEEVFQIGISCEQL